MSSTLRLFRIAALAYVVFFFFFNDTATTEIYTLSLHDALPICSSPKRARAPWRCAVMPAPAARRWRESSPGPPCEALRDRKSTRLNSSHGYISYAVFCLKKKKNQTYHQQSSSCVYRQQGRALM